MVCNLEVQVSCFFQHAVFLGKSLSLKIEVIANLKFASVTLDAQFEREVTAKVLQKMPRNHSLLYTQRTWYDFWSICTGFSCKNTSNLQLNPT